MSFEQFAAIDWSGSKTARQAGIAVAICGAGADAPELVRAGHRWSRAEVLAWLTGEMPARTLVGIDSSPGLPFVDEGAYFPGWPESPADARALWRLVDDLCERDAHLAATSFVKHPEASRYFRWQGSGPGDRFGARGGGRLREVERRQRAQGLNPYSCLNLVGAAQVGKSSLTTMRLLHRLGGALPVWPFDPAPGDGSVLVEIYTTIAARAGEVPGGRSKMLDGPALDAALDCLGVRAHRPLARYSDHLTDAILTAAWLRAHAHDVTLWSPRGLEVVAATEGWTFGVA